jgi:DNA-binding NarL/FixJ family response regulator
MNGSVIAFALPRLVIEIAIIEGHAIFGKALAYMFSRDEQFRVVAEIQSLEAGMFEEISPNVILLDLDTHPIELSAAICICRLHAPNARICVFTQHLKPEVLQRCLAAGADGFLLKDMLPEEFMRAVKTVAEGASYVDPRVAGRILRRRSESHSASEELSLRELDIVRLITDGLSNKEISARLFLSEKTIKNHTSRIFAKFGVAARTQVAVYALKAGLV